MNLSHILQSPVVTEKSTKAEASRKYTFMVHEDANKVEIAKAVEVAYGVKVTKVNIIPIHKKVRLIGRSRKITKRHAGKRAIVTIDAKQTLDFNKVKVSK